MVSLTFLIAGCGFKLRGHDAIPKKLHRFHFSPSRTYSTTSIALRSLFTSLNLNYQQPKTSARLVIATSHDRFSHSAPSTVNASLPTSMTYSQTITLSIKSPKKNNTLIKQTFSATKSVTLNANQIYTAVDNISIEEALSRKIVNQIYYWLISYKVRDTLNHAT